MTRRLVVFGSTGRTGSAVVERALERGHEVTAFTRSPEKIRGAPNVVVGDAADPAAVAGAVAGRDAVITALGVATLEPTTDLSRPTANVVHAAEAAGVERLAAVLSVAVFFTKTSERYAEIRKEHVRNLETLRASSLGWVGLCAATITDEPGTGSYQAVIDAKAPGTGISRLDLADALLDALDRNDWVGHPVGVST